MDSIYPRRLANEYIQPSASFRIFRQTLHQPATLHWHDFYELSLIIGGEGTHVLNGTTHRVSAGSIFLLTPADLHELAPLPGTALELYNLIFSDGMLDEELRRLVFFDIETHHALLDAQHFIPIETEFRRIWNEAMEWKMGQPRIIRGALERILIDLARSCLANPDTATRQTTRWIHRPSPHPAIQDALLYIHHHFRSELSLQDVARQAHLAPNYFSECFHKTTGVPFQNYVQSLRLRLAQTLLSASALSITEICFASGFNSVSHFNRAFKQKFGQAPRAYRRTKGQ